MTTNQTDRQIPGPDGELPPPAHGFVRLPKPVRWRPSVAGEALRARFCAFTTMTGQGGGYPVALLRTPDNTVHYTRAVRAVRALTAAGLRVGEELVIEYLGDVPSGDGGDGIDQEPRMVGEYAVCVRDDRDVDRLAEIESWARVMPRSSPFLLGGAEG